MSFSCSYVFRPTSGDRCSILILILLTLFRHDQERFIEWVNTHEGVQWVRMIDMANEFRSRVAPAANAIMPTGLGAAGA